MHPVALIGGMLLAITYFRWWLCARPCFGNKCLRCHGCCCHRDDDGICFE
jgi:hypothetical protein